MTRTRSSAKQAGSRTEKSVADYLGLVLGRRVERRVKMGKNDCGDLAGIEGWVVEVKDAARFEPGAWATESQREANNATRLTGDVHLPLVVAKRRGKPIEEAFAIVPLHVMGTLLKLDLDIDDEVEGYPDGDDDEG